MHTYKKSLGQHFLQDETICRRIVDELGKHPFAQLLEVGPGGGALTKYLVKIPDIELKAVELDQEKIQFLLRSYPSLEGKILHADFLHMPNPFEGPFSLVGNFPYNISTQILFKVLEWRPAVEQVIGMFQKEVAQRVAAPEGSKVYGVISVLIQAFYDVEYLFEVSETAFVPPPKVKSAVIRLKPKKEVPDMRSERSFFILVKTAFNQRRKMLRNSVKSLFTTEVLEDELFNKRPEQLSLYEFAALTHRMN